MSAGIIGVTEDQFFLMVKRATTFSFAVFTCNRYEWVEGGRNDEVLTRLFRLMTSEEKKIIWTLDFDSIWFKHWLTKPNSMAVRVEHRTSFNLNQAIFNNRFLKDGGKWLQQLLNSTSSVSSLSLFEFPRGRIEDETSLEAAKREFMEETQIKDFEIINPDKPIKYSLKAKDCDRIYNYDYYVAKVKKQHKTIRLENYNQRQEIDEIAMLPADTVKILGDEQAYLSKAALELLG